MSDHNQQSEQSLQQLYAKRKSAHLAPASIKKNVLLKQQEIQNSPPIFQRMIYIATAACTILFFALFSTYQMYIDAPTPYANIVHIHSLNSDTEFDNISRENINNRYAKGYQEYLSQQRTFALHHKKLATLEWVNSGWKLKTCEDDVMLISNELIAGLAKIHQLDPNLVSGDIVNIAFDSSGLILAIEHSNKPLLCS